MIATETLDFGKIMSSIRGEVNVHEVHYFIVDYTVCIKYTTYKDIRTNIVICSVLYRPNIMRLLQS